MLGYFDQQKGKICPQCDLAGTRKSEQDKSSLFAVYICPNRHEYEIDRMFESEVAALRSQIEQECKAMQPRFERRASHEDISNRFQALDRLHVRLTHFIGEDETVAVITQAYENAMQEHAE
jgi:hypothetical protein